MLYGDLQRPQSRSPITYSKALLVEGYDAFRFFKALLVHMNLVHQIEIRNFGGVGDLQSYLPVLLTTPGFHGVQSLGIVRDAESDAPSAFRSVCSVLRTNRLTEPKRPMEVAEGRPRTGVFILPDGENPGMLETLCLQAVSGDPIIPCIDLYFHCAVDNGISLPDNMAKARVQAFLASRSKPGLLLGEATEKGYWPWDAPTFERVKEFLRAL